MVSESPNKQKIIIGIIAVVVLIVLWQIKGLIFTESSSSTEIAPTVATTTTTGTAANPAAPGAKPAVTAAPVPVPASPISQVSLQKDLEFLKVQKEVQQKYLNSINELQLLRIQKDIAEANQAIITSKLATVTAEKDISDLLTQTPAAPTTVAAGAGGTGSPSLAPDQAASQSSETAAFKAKIPTKTEGHYTVVSVIMQFDKWSAIVGYSGKLYRVNVGDTLPPDGSKVLKITNDGVVLEKNDSKTKISVVPAL